MNIPPSLAGRTLCETAIRETTGCNVVAVDTPDGLVVNPPPDTRLQLGADYRDRRRGRGGAISPAIRRPLKASACCIWPAERGLPVLGQFRQISVWPAKFAWLTQTAGQRIEFRPGSARVRDGQMSDFNECGRLSGTTLPSLQVVILQA